MEFGIGYFPTHDAVGPGAIARLVEQRGHESLFFAEHSHIPASRESPYPGGGDLPRKYYHCYDLFVALTAAAAATSKLRVGSGICVVIQRDPLHTAKEVASIDHLSGGRFEFGVGAGWNREEMSNHGPDPRRRMRVMEERIEAMKAVWTQDEASYSGDFVSFDRIWSWPKPAQRPHPPILVGGYGETVLERVLAFGDAWFPNYGPDDLLDRVAELRRRADRHIDVMAVGVPADPRALEPLAEAGFRRVVHWIPSANRRRRPRGARTLGGGDRAAQRRGVTAAEARSRFAAARVARLATAGTDGRPHLVPVVFAVSGDIVYSAVDAKPKRTTSLRRLANVRENPAVALLVDHYEDEDWGALWWVRADGRGRVLDPAGETPSGTGDDPAAEATEAHRAIELLRERYPQQEAAGAVLAVDVERWTGWSGR